MTREEAIERVKTMRWEHATNKDNPDHEAMTMAIEALKQKPNNGEWKRVKIEVYGGITVNGLMCSQCGGKQIVGKWNFCPFCGSKMEEN